MSANRFRFRVLAPAAIVAVMIVYVSGYFALSEATFFNSPPDRWVERKFSNRTVALAYFPVAWAELRVRDMRLVSVRAREDSRFSVLVYSVGE